MDTMVIATKLYLEINAECRQLKAENQRLKTEAETARQFNRISSEKSVELIKENQRLKSDMKTDSWVSHDEYTRQQMQLAYKIDEVIKLKAENKTLREAITERIATEEAKNKKLEAENERLKDAATKLRSGIMPYLDTHTVSACSGCRRIVLAEVREKLAQMVCKDAVAETRAVATLDEVLDELGA